LENFFDSLSVVQIILAIILFAAFAKQVFYYLFFYAKILYYKKKTVKGKVSFSTEQPPISVVICAKNESDNLRNFLPYILNQDYPNYEVIVVNDGSTDESEEILSSYGKEYSHLYHTYLPSEAKFISTKKMALTVGIKAAKNELLLLTDADCKPQGKDWISNIVRNFDDKTEIVLSYGAYFQQKGFVGRLISYDTFFIAMQYMGFALSGKPYMGVGRNLAYRKSLFFKNRGFASHLSLQSGDDDLFVSEVATKQNTRVEVSTESITYSIPKQSFKSWYIQKHRHLTTSPYYKFIPKFLIGAEVFSRFLFYLSFILLAIFGNMWLWIFAGSLFLLRFITQALVINLTAKQMNERTFYFGIILYDILLPLISLNIMLFGNHKKRATKWE
jgi:cellulose synthase/poly-beta-1,6-N-acetylglucosamine synthase-like glycosyltransferase